MPTTKKTTAKKTETAEKKTKDKKPDPELEKLEEQAKEILKQAETQHKEQNFMFVTTFDRYMEHIRHLRALQQAINDEGVLVTKEYVKGRKNLYVNPAVSTYNATAGAADKTAQLLLKYIVAPPAEEADQGDPFDRF